MIGRIIRGVGGFYYVQTLQGLYECKAKGIFRKNHLKPLVGDRVTIEVLEEEKKIGSLVCVEDRKNSLIRPECANVDQIFLVFSVASPDPNYGMLNRYLVMVHDLEIPVHLVVNKLDIGTEERLLDIQGAFAHTAFPIHWISCKEDLGKEELVGALAQKTTVFAGPSGVGKSSLLNWLLGEERMETGSLSLKIERGKNTTRHAEIFPLGEDTFLLDTPGFTSVEVEPQNPENLILKYDEMVPYALKCRFSSCHHDKEKDCSVKEAVGMGLLAKARYQSYVEIYRELRDLQLHS